MTLYVPAALLAATAVVLLGPASALLARARWVETAPRAAVGLWQTIGISALLSGAGSGLCVATERYHAGFVGGLGRLFEGLTSGRPLEGLGLPDALGLTLAADLAVVLVCLLGAVTIRTVRTRARHRHLVDLLSRRRHDSGAAVLDVRAAVAYCIPGIKPRIVVSEGALDLLDKTEVDAVLAHERGHAHERHGLVMLPLVGISKVFGFVPYARLAPPAVAALLEMAADDYAVRRQDRNALVSALVSMATAGALPACSFALTGGSVSRRVERLVRPSTSSARTVLAASGAALALLALPLAILLAV
ncbi:MAG TPA: M56 family metallopeptidase [Acidimicrobiales bacterium]|nr:M56 family metallopeptidase [Acidimicrobiales bacterium]